MSVPNTNTFSLDDVRVELGLAHPTSQSVCFATAVDAAFDPVYKGSKDRLSNFRNYSHRISTTFSLYSGGGSGEVYGQSTSSWANVRGAVNGYLDTSDPYRVGVFNDYTNSVWEIRRLFLCYDLSGLAGKTIYSASLGVGIRSILGASYGVYAVMASQGIPLNVGHFGNIVFGSFAMSNNTIVTGASGCLNYLRLDAANSSQLLNIQGAFGGLLKIALIHYYDQGNIEPAHDEDLNYNLFQVGECITNCVCAPVLIIEHSV
jgi:hypothetical protein